MRLPVVPPEGGAFALAQRNLDPLPDEVRDRWAGAVMRGSPRGSVALPERLIIELLNSCNLDCPMCRVGEFGVDLDRQMPFELFCRIAEELFGHVREVRLNGLGETTIVPDLDRYLDVLGRYPVRLELITDGTGKRAIYERLLATGAIVLVSWDAARPEVFERVRRPAHFAQLAQTMTDLGRAAAGLAAKIATRKPVTFVNRIGAQRVCGRCLERARYQRKGRGEPRPGVLLRRVSNQPQAALVVHLALSRTSWTRPAKLATCATRSDGFTGLARCI
jgi:hypothetical protein